VQLIPQARRFRRTSKSTLSKTDPLKDRRHAGQHWTLMTRRPRRRLQSRQLQHTTRLRPSESTLGATPPIAAPRHHLPGEHNPTLNAPNVQHSAAAEGRRLQCIVRRSPPSLKLLIALAGRDPPRGPPAAHVARPPRGYHKHAGRGQLRPPSAREPRPRFTTAEAPDKQLQRVARQPRHAPALGRPRAHSTRQPRPGFRHGTAKDR
jgi:hypothetical protein